MQKEVRAKEEGAPAMRRTSGWRIAGWGGALLLLILPFVAMQFTREVNWTAGDFIFAALMFGTAGCTIELAVGRVEQEAVEAEAGQFQRNLMRCSCRSPAAGPR